MNDWRIPALQMAFTKASREFCERETLYSKFGILRLLLVKDQIATQNDLLTFIIYFWWAGGINASNSLLVMRRGACIFIERKCPVAVRRGVEDMTTSCGSADYWA